MHIARSNYHPLNQDIFSLIYITQKKSTKYSVHKICKKIQYKTYTYFNIEKIINLNQTPKNNVCQLILLTSFDGVHLLAILVLDHHLLHILHLQEAAAIVVPFLKKIVHHQLAFCGYCFFASLVFRRTTLEKCCQ